MSYTKEELKKGVTILDRSNEEIIYKAEREEEGKESEDRQYGTGDAVERYRQRRKERLDARGFRADDDEDGENDGGGKHGNTKIPFGLCQREGIKVQPGWTPKDAWDALEGKGYSAGDVYKELKDTGKVSEKKKSENESSSVKSVAKTVEEANKIGKNILGDIYERHRIENSLVSTPRENFAEGSGLEEYSPFKADYGKLPVEIANSFNGSIEKLSMEFDTTIQKVRMMDAKETLAATAGKGAFASVWHDYSTDESTLIINPVKCGDYGKLASRIKELSVTGYCAKIKDGLEGSYVPTHEFAHTIVDMVTPLDKKRNFLGADYKKVERVRKEIKGIYERYTSEISKLEEEKKYWSDKFRSLDTPDIERGEAFDHVGTVTKKLKEKKISAYSMTSADEFMAEAFTNEMIGEKSNPYGVEVMKVLRENFGRKKG